MPDDNEVGYGKPPKSTRFKKGQSGNSKGRPKGTQNLATVFHRVGRELVAVKENGRTRKLPKQEAIARRFTNNALTGPERAMRDYMTASRAFPEPEAVGLTTSNVPESHKAVMADIVRRIRECDSTEQTSAESKQSNCAEEEGEEK